MKAKKIKGVFQRQTNALSCFHLRDNFNSIIFGVPTRLYFTKGKNSSLKVFMKFRSNERLVACMKCSRF